MGQRLLVVTAVDAERGALLTGVALALPAQCRTYPLLRGETRAGEVTCVSAGVGPVAAATCAATMLAADGPYDLVISAGVAGGFAGRAAPGDVVLADRVILADLGADSPDGFQSVDELGFGRTETALDADLMAALARRMHRPPMGRPVTVGTVLTVSTATGTDERAAWLRDRYQPTAEAMEGAGVLAAAQVHGVPFLELRGISNAVGRRDRAAWDLPRALTVMGHAFHMLLREPVLP